MTLPAFRVGLVGPLPPPAGGMANQTVQLADLLRGEGVEVEIVQTNSPYKPAWVSSIKGMRALIRLFPYLIRLWNVAGRVQIIHVMANSGWSWHLFAAPAVWIGVWRKTPVLVNYRGGLAPEFLARSHAWIKPTLRKAEKLIIPSMFLRRVFEGYGVPAHVIPNIVDSALFSAVRDAPCFPMQSPHFMVARNLEEIYDNATAIKAFVVIKSHYPNARLTLAGEGPELSRLIALVGELNLAESVTFTGRLQRREMADLYRDADVLINSSKVDNMPNSLLEAMASGLPIVSTSVGGIPDMVEDEVTALLVGPENPSALALAALRLLRDRGLYVRLMENGREKTKEYTWSKIKESWLSVYAECVQK